MQCADLDRYLEAFLDGRLGRSRALVLRRHLVGCLVCRARFEQLRQFERDLACRLRNLERCESLWAGLELDLVRSGEAALPHLPAASRALPPPRAAEPSPVEPPAPATPAAPPRPPLAPRARRLRHHLWGLAVFFLAAGLTVQVGVWLLEPRRDGAGLLQRIKGDPPVEFRSPDAAAVRSWLSDRLASPVPNVPVPEGFELLGGRIDDLDGLASGVLVYRRGDDVALVYLQPRRADGGELGTDLLSKIQGGARLAWQDREFSYAVVSSLPAADLVGLGRAPLDR